MEDPTQRITSIYDLDSDSDEESEEEAVKVAELSWKGHSRSLFEGQNLIGASSESNQVEIEDPSMSKTHASIDIILMEPSKQIIATVRDLGSTNGTFVQKTAEVLAWTHVKKGKPKALFDGCQVRFGSVIASFRFDHPWVKREEEEEKKEEEEGKGLKVRFRTLPPSLGGPALRNALDDYEDEEEETGDFTLASLEEEEEEEDKPRVSFEAETQFVLEEEEEEEEEDKPRVSFEAETCFYSQCHQVDPYEC